VNESSRWLLLVHNIPPKPQYLRAKVMRRLTKLGALALKRSAYLLPSDDSALEDFQWLRHEIRAEGGDAWIVEAQFVAGLRDDEIRENFRAMRSAEYQTLAAEARTLLGRLQDAGAPDHEASIDADVRRMLRRVETTRRIDFFHADGRDEVEALMSSIDRLVDSAEKKAAEIPARDALRARTWLTRKGVKVDRMASAWLIRRFIDPAATFMFVTPDQTAPAADALRFDMFEGEFTHDGNRCTFEVLLDVSGHAEDRGLVALAQIVHDLDVRDDRYQRPETAGVAALLDGIVARIDDDHRRLAESAPLFDALHASLRGTNRQTTPEDK